MVFVHLQRALRRLRFGWFRFLLVVVASGLTSLSILSARTDLQQLNAASVSADHLHGYPIYQLTLVRATVPGLRHQTSTMPASLVDMAAARSHGYLLELSHPVRVVTQDRFNAKYVFPVYYSDTAFPLSKSVGFPPCAFTLASRYWDKLGQLIPIGTSWRCTTSSVPPPLQTIVAHDNMDAILLPLASRTEISGRKANDDVRSMWIAASQAELNLIVATAKSQHLTLQINTVGAHLGSRLRSLSTITKVWLIIATSLLLTAGLFYLLEMAPMLRREMLIRLCLGVPQGAMVVWLLTELVFLVLSIALSSAAWVLPVAQILGFHLGDIGSGLYIGLLLFFTVLSLLAWEIVRRQACRHSLVIVDK